MKKSLFYLMLFVVFACNEDEAPKQLYSFGGSVMLSQLEDEPVPFANAKLKITFFSAEVPMVFKESESTSVSTDSQGKYLLEMNLPVNAYQAYTVAVDDQYYHNCTGITSPLILSDYKALDAGQNEADLLVCHTGIVKVIADKVSSGSGNSLVILHKGTKGSTTFSDVGVLADSDKEYYFPFFDGVTDVVFTFQKKTSNTVTEEENIPVNIVAGTTVVLNVDF